MIPEIGYMALILALVLALVQTYPSFSHIRLTSAFIFGLVAIAFGCLVFSYMVSDFSVVNVYNNSHTEKPFIYKISGAWGNHEGSMLLLTLIISAYEFVFCKYGKVEDKTKDIIVKVQSLINAGFLAFIIFTSNPFQRISPVPENGLGLNPLLQDVGLALHPPILYVGYIGFSLAFAFAVAALIEGKVERDWAVSLKRWTLFSWSFLTFGIGLGSWWAYRELGWGGIWFWDPVENASLIPWLAVTAFLHSLIVLEKRGTLVVWTILLAICSFAFSLMGIFLVRSGILTSVHAFANDPARGMFILAFLGLVVGISFVLFSLRAHKLSTKHDFSVVSKEGSILINNLLLSVACMTVILGTLYPLFLEIFSEDRVSVGAPYFNTTLSPMVLPLLALAAIAPSLKWQSDKVKSLMNIISIPLIVGVFVGALVFLFTKTNSILAILVIASSVWLIAAMLLLLWKKAEMKKYPKIKKLPNTLYGMVIAHIGVAVLVIGIVVSSTWQIEKEQIIKHSEFIKVSNYKVTLGDMYILTGENYLAREGIFYITNNNGDEIAILRPQVRFYPIEETNTTEAAIYYSLLSNLYIAMGDSDDQGGFVVRVYYKPLINLVWLGCLLMVVGGIMALLNRKGK